MPSGLLVVTISSTLLRSGYDVACCVRLVRFEIRARVTGIASATATSNTKRNLLLFCAFFAIWNNNKTKNCPLSIIIYFAARFSEY